MQHTVPYGGTCRGKWSFMGAVWCNITNSVFFNFVYKWAIGNGIWRDEWSHDRWRHMTLKGHSHEWPQYAYTAQYLENSLRMLFSNGRWSLHSLLWGSTVGYPSDSLGCCLPVGTCSYDFLVIAKFCHGYPKDFEVYVVKVALENLQPWASDMIQDRAAVSH